METVEHLIVGAGPAGLRAAQVLGEAGREVLVIERSAVVGPKTCAGGLTPKSVRLLRALGLPSGAGLRSVGHVAFACDRLEALHSEDAAIVTLPRRELGGFQLRWAREAGAEVWTGVAASGIDLARRRVRVGERLLRWTHLVGADGADSAVRRALGLPSPRACFAAEYNVPGVRLEPLRVEAAPDDLAGGYFWVFPHCHYTSVGAVALKRSVPPREVRRFLDRRARALGVGEAVPFEAAALEVEYAGSHFPGGVHLAGDAAGMPSSLTAEGIYQALVTGEEVARRILEPSFPSPLTTRWLRVKRRHDRLASLLRHRAPRRAVLAALDRLARCGPARRPMAGWFLAA